MISLDDRIRIGSRWRHLGRGTEYTVLYTGRLQVSSGDRALDGFPVVVYIDSHEVWIRPIDEFLDGRFEPLSDLEPERT